MQINCHIFTDLRTLYVEGQEETLVEVEVGGGYVEVEGGFQGHELASEEDDGGGGAVVE